MTLIKRLDRMIVRLCYVRNMLTKHNTFDFDLDLSSCEASVESLFEETSTEVQELEHDNPRD
jgi:hypothetical protein